jgi:hypothetical protein
MSSLSAPLLAQVLVATLTISLAANGAAPEKLVPPINPAFKGSSKACYVRLKPRWTEVEFGDHQACRAVLDNLNRFCGAPPQYEQRKLHRATKNLSAPVWVAMEPTEELVKQTWSVVASSKNREAYWASSRDKVMAKVQDGSLRLFKADIGPQIDADQVSDLRGALQTVYKLETLRRFQIPGFNQPLLMFAEHGKETPYKVFDQMSTAANADLWEFRQQWLTIHFDPYHKWFEIGQLSLALPDTEGLVVSPVQCTIQHINDRRGVK